MNKPFAKLFETDRGQILVKIDADEDGAPEIRFYAEPTGLGVCSLALSYEDFDNGWDAAEHAFGKVDQQIAMQATEKLFETANKLAGGEA
ncbi:hypothetical protein EV683_10542 [Crenobacter luteus]|uniref:hypothetical protein n=1 Tax=Crenobacter luteus TaxID=1452487 RepID=UPI001046E5A4|nr:hypothetical protein [Crenobacter luteus]TCP13797.1 hypothetical protein EV683_10542 [Crenobacter luteus]